VGYQVGSQINRYFLLFQELSIDLVGEHAAATWKFVKRGALASAARASILGVEISAPKHPQSLKPRSSATMMRKFGRGLRFGVGIVVAGGGVGCVELSPLGTGLS
jgi:hypothetical protein